MSNDWTPATLSNLAGMEITFTLDATGDPVVASFATAEEAMRFVANTGPKFEYSAAEAAVRDANGTVVPLPARPAGRRECGPKECDMIANGHKPHWIPALRAANGPKEDWLPITILEQDGTKMVFSTEEGVETVYNHDPERVAGALYFNRSWQVLRGGMGETGYPVSLVSFSPIGPCSCAVESGS